MAVTKKKPMTDKQKKSTAKKLGTGAARKAADAVINRKKQLEDAMKASGASNTKGKKKKKTYTA